MMFVNHYHLSIVILVNIGQYWLKVMFADEENYFPTLQWLTTNKMAHPFGVGNVSVAQLGRWHTPLATGLW